MQTVGTANRHFEICDSARMQFQLTAESSMCSWAALVSCTPFVKEQEESPTRATANCHDSHVFVEQNNRFQAMGRQGLHSILSCIDNVGGSLRQFEHSSCPTRSCGLSPVRPTLPTLHSTPKRPLAPLRFPKLSPARALPPWPLLLNLRLLIRVCWSWSCGAEQHWGA